MWCSKSKVFSLTFLLYTSFSTGQKSGAEVSKFAFSEKCGEISEIVGDARTLVPWNVAIFRRSSNSNSFTFINSGVLISNTTVLTLFGGKYGASVGLRKYHIPPAETFLVAVGLNSTSLKTADEFTQMTQVSYILPYRHHEEDNQFFHFWLYHLSKPFNINTPYARIPCLPFFLSKLPKLVELVHGGFTSPPARPPAYYEPSLRVKSSLALPQEDCASLFKKNYGGQTASYVWCSTLNPSNLDENEDTTQDFCFMHSSAVVTKIVNRYFLAGLTALIPDRKMGKCTPDTTYIHAKTIDTIEWMFSNIRCGSDAFSCVNSTCIPLSEACNRAQSCPDDDFSDEDPIFCKGQNRCRKGPETIQCGIKSSCIRPEQLCDKHPDCSDASDEDHEFCNPQNHQQQHLT